MKKVTSGVKSKVMKWAFECNNTGMSSEALAYFLSTGSVGRHGVSHPHDPSDLKRCFTLFEWVPELKERLPLIAKESEVWAKLVKDWDYLELTLNAEWPTGRAPITYKAMKQMGC